MAAQPAAKTIDLSGLADELRSMGVDPSTVDLSRSEQAIRERLARDMAQRFQEGKDATGRAWKPVQRGGRPLVKTGLLAAAASSLEATRAVRTGDGLTVTQDMSGAPFYWRFHDDGTATIPQRQFTGVSEGAANDVVEIVADDVARQVLGQPA